MDISKYYRYRNYYATDKFKDITSKSKKPRPMTWDFSVSEGRL